MRLYVEEPKHHAVSITHGTDYGGAAISCSCGFVATVSYSDPELADMSTAPALIEVAGLMDVHIMNHRPR